ncbi:MAG: aryl-sulfate sulfotransferase [Bacteroidota bacterium]
MKTLGSYCRSVSGNFLVYAYCLTILATLSFSAQAAGRKSVVYLSPLPDSRHLSPNTNIIIRTIGTLDSSIIQDSSFISLRGSESGEHSWRCALSDDERTIVFTPTRPFTQGERVTVQTIRQFRTREGFTIGPFSFEFEIGFQPPVSQLLTQQDVDYPVDAPSAVRSEKANYRPLSTSFAQSDSMPKDFPLPFITHLERSSSGKIFLGTFKSGRAGAHQEFITYIPSDEEYVMILDSKGIPMRWKKTASENMGFTLQPNGHFTYYDASLKYFVELDSSLNVVTNYQCGNGYTTDLHELRILGNGHALLMGNDPEIVDMSKIVQGGNSNATVWGMVIQELDQEKNVIFQWRSFDHFLVTDATHEDLTSANIDYVHANALELDSDGNILLSSRHLDEITKIDRTTGDIIWRWGGKNNQFQFVNDTLHFSHQHSIRRTVTGTYILFDNGNFRPVEFSRGVEYVLDEQEKTATLIWQYRHTPDIFAVAMGSIERLPDGNTLLGWGTAAPAFTEVHPDGSIALEAQLPDSILSYRAWCYDWPQSASTLIKESSQTPTSFSLEQNYPNPFNPTTMIRYSIPEASEVTISVHDVVGRKVATLVNQIKAVGEYSVLFKATRLPSGTYIVRLRARSISNNKISFVSRKILLLK